MTRFERFFFASGVLLCLLSPLDAWAYFDPGT